jgi:hypothetical protein
MFAAILVWLVIRASLPEVMREPARWSVVGLSVLALLAVVTSLVRWRGIGFATQDASRLLFGPTVGMTFWNQPHVSAVLLARPDAAPACATPAPDTVRAMLHAIEDASGRLTGRARQAGSVAAEAARALVDTIERLEGEIETLTRNADPEELANVERRLTQLPEGQRDPRDHLEHYAKWMRGQADLLEVRRLDRDDATGTLRAIWTVLERLREQSTRGIAPEAEVLERLHALAAGRVRGPRGPRGPQGANSSSP